MKVSQRKLKQIIVEEYDAAEINKLKADVEGHMGMISVLASLLKQLPEFKDVPIADHLADANKGVATKLAARADAAAHEKQIAQAAAHRSPVPVPGIPSAKRVAQREGNTTMKATQRKLKRIIKEEISRALKEQETRDAHQATIQNWKLQLVSVLGAVMTGGDWGPFIKLLKDKTVGPMFIKAASEKLGVPISQRAVYKKFYCAQDEAGECVRKLKSSERFKLANAVCGGPCKEG